MLLVYGLRAQSQPVPYTLEDRERLIRLEERFVALDKKIEAQGASLTDKIEAQGVSLTEKIEAQVASLTDKIEAQGEALNKRIDALSKRMDEMQTFLLWGFGMTFTFMLGLVGFVLWDRRGYLKPVMADTRELMENGSACCGY